MKNEEVHRLVIEAIRGPEFPIKVPLFTGQNGRVVPDRLCAFQEKTGGIVVFHLSWEASSGYEIKREEYPDLNDLFLKHPQYLQLLSDSVTPPPVSA